MTMPGVGGTIGEQQPDVGLQNYARGFNLPPGLMNLLQSLLPRLQRDYNSDLSGQDDVTKWPGWEQWLGQGMNNKDDYMSQLTSIFGTQAGDARYNATYDRNADNKIDIDDWSGAARSNTPWGAGKSPWDYINQFVPSVLGNAYRGGGVKRQGVI